MVDLSDRTSVSIAICTYKRNHDLAVLLRAIQVCADRVRDRAAIGVSVVDDTADGQARSVVETFANQFELGLQYNISGRQNISLARNMAIESAIGMAEWTVMTDDDCEPPPEWIGALLDAQARTGADCVTGRMIRRAPPGAPRWLETEPFFDLGVADPEDGTMMDAAATFNSMIRSQWLRDRPEMRFDPAYGKIGGEDMVFYRAAHAAGLRIRFAADAFVYENESAERATFGYQMYVHYWHGNSTYLCGVERGIPRWRMAVHGIASMVRAIRRPILRMASGRSPQLRYCLARMLHAAGQLVGPLGIRVEHR